MARKLHRLSCLVMMIQCLVSGSLQAATYGSETAVSVVNPYAIPTATNNIIRTFGCVKNGFRFADVNTTCSFDSIFPVAGPISLRGGNLFLFSDLVLTNTGTLADLGSIRGNNHVVELSQYTRSLASGTQPNGKLVLNLVANLTAAQTPRSIDWSYDGQYLAVTTASVTGNDLRIYRFNGTSLTLAAGADLAAAGHTVRWHPNSYYLLVTTAHATFKVRLYLFTAPSTLTAKNYVTPTGIIYAGDWNRRGDFIVVGGIERATTNQGVVYKYAFNQGSEVFDSISTATNNGVRLGGIVQFEGICCAPLGNLDDVLVVTASPATTGSMHLYNVNAGNLDHVKGYALGKRALAVDWAKTSTYVAVGYSDGTLRTYQHDVATNTVVQKQSYTITGQVNSVHWKPNATELAVGRATAAAHEFQIYGFYPADYSLLVKYPMALTTNVYAVRYFVGTDAYIARIDSGTRLVAVYKENYSPFIFKDVNLRVNGNLTLGAPVSFYGNCSINAQHNRITFTGDGSINVAPESSLDVTLAKLNFTTPTSFAMQGNSSTVTFRDSDIILDSDIVVAGGKFDMYGDLNIVGPYAFELGGDYTSTVRSNAHLNLMDGAILSLGKKERTNSEPLYFEDRSSQLNLSDATLKVTDYGFGFNRGTINVWGNSALPIDTTVDLKNTFSVGDGINSGNDPSIIIRGNGSTLNIEDGLFVFNTAISTTVLQFYGQSQLVFDTTTSVQLKRAQATTDGWILTSTYCTIDFGDNYFLADGTHFSLKDRTLDYYLTGTRNLHGIILDQDDELTLNPGTLTRNVTIAKRGNLINGIGVAGGALNLVDYNSSVTWDIASRLGVGDVYLNGGRIAFTKNSGLEGAYSFKGSGTIDLGSSTFELGPDTVDWNGNIYWIGNGGAIKFNGDVLLSGIWTFSGNVIIDGNDRYLDLDPTGTIILERGAKVTIQNFSVYDISRQHPIVCMDDNCEITLKIADLLLNGDYLFDKGSLYVYYDSRIGVVDGLDETFTFTYASVMPSTIDSFCYLKIMPNTRFSIGRQDSSIVDPTQQPLVFNDPLTARLILDGGTLHVTSSGMIMTAGTMEIASTSNIEIDTPHPDYGLIVGDGTLDNDFAINIKPGVQLNIDTGSLYYQNHQNNRLVFSSPASSLSIQSPGGFVAKKNVFFNGGWLRPLVDQAVSTEPGAFITANNLRIDYPDLFCDYNVSGTLIDSSLTLLGSNDYIVVSRGNSVGDLLVSGQNVRLSGIGGPLGTITMDNNSSLTWDIPGVIGGSSIDLNSGKLALTQGVLATAGFTFQGTGTVDVGTQIFQLGTESVEWDGRLYWISNGGILKFNSDVTLSGIWTFSGSIVIDGNGYIVDLAQTGSIILERGAKVEFQNTSINNLSRQNPVTCSDDNCELTLNFVDLLFGGDYLFDKGSLYLYYDSYFGAFGGLDTTFTFTYASTQTSTIDSQCILGVWPNMRFAIGRQDSSITDPERQPLVFTDPLTSKLILDGGTLHITSSGMIMTKGTLDVASTSNIEIENPQYEYGLIIGDGTEANDFELDIAPGVLLNVEDGSLFYENYYNDRLVFASPASSLKTLSRVGVYAKTDLTLSDGTIITEDPYDVAITGDAAIRTLLSNVTRVYRAGRTLGVQRSIDLNDQFFDNSFTASLDGIMADWYSTASGNISILSDESFTLDPSLSFSDIELRQWAPTYTTFADGRCVWYNNGLITSPYADFYFTGTRLSSGLCILSGGEFVLVKGALPLPVYVFGSNNVIRGVGDIGNTITLRDADSQLVFEVEGAISSDVIVGGGALQLGKDLTMKRDIVLTGSGNLDLSQYTLDLYFRDTAWTSTLTIASDAGGKFNLSSDMILTSKLQFEGECTINGNFNVLDLRSMSEIVVRKNSKLTLKNVTLSRLSGNKIRCMDDSASIEMSNAYCVMDGDFSFTVGSISFKDMVDFCNSHTFIYQSTMTSTIQATSKLSILDNTALSVGKKTSITQRQPFYFIDRTSQLSFQNGSLMVNANGINLTRGTLEVKESVNFDIASTDSTKGLILGDGTAGNDLVCYWHPQSTVNGVRGAFVSNLVASPIISTARFVFGTTFHTWFWQTTTLSDVCVEFASNWTNDHALAGVDVYYDNLSFAHPGIGYTINAVRCQDPAGAILMTGGGNSIISKTGSMPIWPLITGSDNSIYGNGGLDNPIYLLDGSAILNLGLNGLLRGDVDLGGGKVVLTDSVLFADTGAMFAGTGTVNASNKQVYIGTQDYVIRSTIYWDCNDAFIVPVADMRLTSIWTVSGVCTVFGNGESTLSLNPTGTIVVERGSTLSLKDIAIKGLKAEQIYCKDNSGKIICDNVTWVQDSGYTFSKGAFDVLNNLIMDGGNKRFVFKSNRPFTIKAGADMACEQGFEFAYQPSSVSRTLFNFEDSTATLRLNAATLSSTATGLQLTKGKLVIEDTCYLQSAATYKAEGIVFGDGTSAANNVTIDILPEATLNLASGYLDYKNIP